MDLNPITPIFLYDPWVIKIDHLVIKYISSVTKFWNVFQGGPQAQMDIIHHKMVENDPISAQGSLWPCLGHSLWVPKTWIGMNFERI